MCLKESKSKKTLYLLLAFDLVLIVFISIFPENSKKYLKEFQLFTWLSLIKLLILSYINWKIYSSRKIPQQSFSLSHDYSIWFIIACGFFFLAFDDLLLIHENTDKLIHKVFSIQETNLTDRIDDTIILIYAILGILVLYSYRNELMKFGKSLPYFVIGYCFLFSKIVIDFITNKNDVVPKIISDEAILYKVNYVLAITEGGSKLLAETFFIFAFYLCFKLAAILKKQREKA